MLAVRDLAPCPICRDRIPVKEKSIYCSDECRTAAYNYRKRLMDVKNFLSHLGFIVEYHTGIILRTTIPFELTHFYPTSLRSFEFVPLAVTDRELVNTVNADDYWKEFESFLSPMVTNFIRWQFDEQGRYHIDTAKALMIASAKVAMQSEGRHFQCQKCGSVYIQSEASYNSESETCNDCLIKTRPF